MKLMTDIVKKENDAIAKEIGVQEKNIKVVKDLFNKIK
jgi:hypothetical protein